MISSRRRSLLFWNVSMISVAEDARGFEALATPLAAGAPVPKPQGVFPRFVEEESEDS